MQYIGKFKEWLSFDGLEDYLRDELISIANDDEMIKERFFYDLKFGTAGLRGIIGAGTDRMNIYTVRRATQGLASFIAENKDHNKGVAIAFDSRNFSSCFAKEAACVLAGNGIKVYLFDELRPTPELSFAVRHLGCAAGIVVTASHNPKEYNGYKVYGSDGGQVANDAADIITHYIEQTSYFNGIKYIDEAEAVSRGLLEYIGKDTDEAYLKCVFAESVNPQIIKEQSDLKIVFTPFHGAGNKLVRETLKRAGFKNVYVVPEQELPDGNFPTVKSPNPENPEGFELAVKLAKETGANIIVGTDPDCDRVGVLVQNKNGDFIPLTGNQTGVLLLEYILSGKQKNGTLPSDSVVIKTVVTTNLTDRVCENYNTKLEEVLTGFKYIADKIKEYEKQKTQSYIMGYEESYGYLIGTYTRDKDAVSAVLLIAEMAAWYKSRGMSLYEGLMELFEKYGYHREDSINLYLTGIDGAAKIKSIMSSLRNDLPEVIGGLKVVSISDISTGKRLDLINEKEYKINLPSSNVLKFEMDGGAWLAFRPSGTEPKLKAYAGVAADTDEECISILERIMADANKITNGEKI
jgi:phosphoglucomutase